MKYFSQIPLLLLVASAGWAQRVQPMGNISGELRMDRGSFPPSPIIVKLETRGQMVGTVYTDGQGAFSFSNLVNNAYTITIDDPAYKPATLTVALNVPFTAPDVHVNMTLYPVTKADEPRPTARMSGSNPYLVHLSEMEQSLPKDAKNAYDKAVKLEHSGKSDEAAKLYGRVLERVPKFYPARNNLGTALTSTGEYGKAEQAFVQVIKENPSDPNAYLNLGNLYLITKHYPESEHALKVGLEHDPNSAFGHFVLGSLLDKTGKGDEAEHELRKCIELDPEMSRAHLALVNLYLQDKRTDQAKQELQLFLKTFPSDPMAKQAKQVLARLEKEH